MLFKKIDKAIAKHALKEQISTDEAQKLFNDRLFEILQLKRLVKLASPDEKDSIEFFKEKYPEDYKKLENSSILVDISRQMAKNEGFSLLDGASKFIHEYVNEDSFTIENARELISNLLLSAIKKTQIAQT